MNIRDRQLLATVARVTRSTGAITLGLLELTADDHALATGFRELGRQYASLAAELVKRAGDLDGVIDLRP